MGDGVLAEVDTALVLDLLDLEGHEHCQGFGGESAEGIDFPYSDGEDCIQPIQLLILEDRHLAHRHFFQVHDLHKFIDSTVLIRHIYETV